MSDKSSRPRLFVKHAVLWRDIFGSKLKNQAKQGQYFSNVYVSTTFQARQTVYVVWGRRDSFHSRWHRFVCRNRFGRGRLNSRSYLAGLRQGRSRTTSNWYTWQLFEHPLFLLAKHLHIPVLLLLERMIDDAG